MRSCQDFSVATIFVTALLQLWGAYAATDCIPREAEYGTVCVCNATYCDNPGPVELPPTGQFLYYVTTKAGDRFKKNTGEFIGSSPGEDIRVIVNRSQTFQKMYGFGGAMTDSAALNIRNLSQEAQEMLLRTYFSVDGINYTLVRVPMGGSDFSTHAYSYDDAHINDTTLQYFNLAEEDIDYKIPLLQRAQEISKNSLLLFTAPWSSPTWMKSNNEFNGQGYLKKDYYEVWAQYFVKFLEAYSEHGLEFWALSTGNEPASSCTPNFAWNCIRWSAEDSRDWIANNLGPALEKSFPNVKIMTLDDQRMFLPAWPDVVLANHTAKQYVDGVALHWYADIGFDPNLMDETHEHWPDVFLLYTEACTGVEGLGEIPIAPGSWDRGVKYLDSLIQTSNHWVSGWTDWNMALNLEGGPNWAGNMDDSPIHVNSTADEFYKQPMFYAMGHFSKFVPEGSTRIGLVANQIDGTAFVTPEGATVVVLINKKDDSYTATIVDGDRGEALITVPANSFNTLIWS